MACGWLGGTAEENKRETYQTVQRNRETDTSHDSPANLLMAGLFYTAPWCFNEPSNVMQEELVDVKMQEQRKNSRDY